MILKALSEATGVSGNEKAVQAIVVDAIRDHVDEIEIDAMGSVLVTKRGTGAINLRVMLDAHIDEIGLMIVGHESDGYLKFRPVGGIDARLLPGALVQVGDDRIPGVIGLKPVHLLKPGEGEKVAKIDALAIDIGAQSDEEAKGLAPVGTYATFKTEYREFGPTVTGKAFDDRVGCAVLIELLRGEPQPFDLVASFSTQEEIGLRGAQVAAYRLEPDCAFGLEGTIADDIPKEKDVSPTTTLGQGPALTVMDRSFIADRRLLKLLVDTAEALDIPHQFKQPGIGGTDAGAIHKTRAGVPAATVSVPCRYIHSPVAMMNLNDFDNTVRLMRESLARLTERTLERERK